MIQRLILATLLAGLAVFAAWRYWPSAEQRVEPTRLTIMNWEDYIDPDVVREFEQEANARVEWIYFEDDFDRDNKLKERSTLGVDLVLVNEQSLFLYRKRGWIDRVDTTKVPNLRNIDSQWYQRFPLANQYAVPYFWGTTGVIYRSDMLAEPITHWMQLFEPGPQLTGRIQMPSDPRELVTSALIARGYSVNSERPVDYNRAADLLLGQQPHVHTYSAVELDETTPIVTGEVVVATSYNGDALTLKDMQESIEYVVPEEGGGFWMDFLTVMSNSDHKPLAYRFLDFLNRPEIASRNAEFVYYATPNTAAIKLLPAEFRDNPTIFPDDATLARCESQNPLPGWIMRQIENIAQRVVDDAAEATEGGGGADAESSDQGN